MDLHPLAPRSLFDLGDPLFAGLFEGTAWPWEALGPHLETYLRRILVPGIRGEVDPRAVLVGDDIQVEPGAVIEAGAYVKGPCYVGAGAQVRHAAYVRGVALIGPGAVVGHATEVKGSAFLPRAKAGHFGYVGDSLLGSDVNLGAGTKLANLRFGADEVCVRHDGERLATGLRKLGAILGDRSQTGCNAVVNPGTVLGRDCRVGPCVAVSGTHAAGSTVRE